MADQAPAPQENGTNVVAIIAILVLVGLAVVFVMYVLPSLQKPEETPPGTKIEVQLPPSSPEPQPQPSPSPY